MFASITIPPFFFIYFGKLAEGLTKFEVPTTIIKSDLFITLIHSLNTDLGIGSPNNTVSNFIIPPHSHKGGKIVVDTESLGNFFSHLIHLHLYLLPCISVILLLPAFVCSSSTFCVIICFKYPNFSNFANAICALFGTAFSTDCLNLVLLILSLEFN